MSERECRVCHDKGPDVYWANSTLCTNCHYDITQDRADQAGRDL